MSKRITKARASQAGLTTLALLFFSTAVSAQGGEDIAATDAPVEVADSYGTEAIIVTAQRREEASTDVPITIAAFGQDQLEAADVTELRDVERIAPAVRFDVQGGFFQPSIRGVGSAIVGAGAGSNIGIYVDGFYAPSSTAANFQLLNVENVQVLKGPQGTLFGRGTTGGAILVTTARPSTEFGGRVRASYESFNTANVQAYVTGGIGDDVAVDAEVLYHRTDGFVDNIFTGDKDVTKGDGYALRLGVAADLTDRLSVLLRYKHADEDDPRAVSNSVYRQNGVPQTIANIIPGAVIGTRRGDVSTDQRNSFRVKTDMVQLTAELDLDFATLTSYSQYREDEALYRQDLDYSSASVFAVEIPSTERLITQELLLNSKGDGPLKWTAGAFYLNYKNQFNDNLGSVSGGPFALISDTGATSESIALFGDATYEIVPDLFLTGGLRYSHDRVYDGYINGGPIIGGFGYQEYPEIKRDALTPRAVIRWKPSASSSIYASYTRGEKPGIIDTSTPPSSPASRPVRPEKITAYEVGYKYGSPDINLDIAAYYYDYRNLQIATPVGTSTITTNAADSEIYGLEAQTSFRMSEGFRANASVAYTHARYKNFENSIRYNQCLDPVACGLGTGLFLLTPFDASGLQMQRAPDFTGNFGLSYDTDFAGGSLSLSGNLYFTSDFYWDTSEQFKEDGYKLLNLRAAWTNPSEKLTLAVFGTNVTDTKYRSSAITNLYGVGTVYGTPASVGVSADFAF